MNRRQLLRLGAGAGVAGGAIAGGYLATAGLDAFDSGDHRWRHGVRGRLDAVRDSVAFVRERTARSTLLDRALPGFGPTADGEVAALDVDTGEVRWTHGEAVGMDSYTDLAVADGVYFGYCTDDFGDCSDLTALDRDGTVRWTRDVNPGPYRPFVVDDAVYVGGHSSPVRAHDAATGETHWKRAVDGGEGLVDVDDDSVYVETAAETGDGVVGLDRETGRPRWRYDLDDDQVVTGVAVADGVAYVVSFDRIVAVDGGDERWRRPFESIEEATIAGTASGHLFVLVERSGAEDGRGRFRLDAIDVSTGDRNWTLASIERPGPGHRPAVSVHDETVYVGADRLRALDATTGDERWRASFDGGPILSATVDESDSPGAYSVFSHSDDGRIAAFAPDGERTWTASVPEAIESYRVGDSVVVATEAAIYGLDR